MTAAIQISQSKGVREKPINRVIPLPDALIPHKEARTILGVGSPNTLRKWHSLTANKLAAYRAPYLVREPQIIHRPGGATTFLDACYDLSRPLLPYHLWVLHYIKRCKRKLAKDIQLWGGYLVEGREMAEVPPSLDVSNLPYIEGWLDRPEVVAQITPLAFKQGIIPKV